MCVMTNHLAGNEAFNTGNDILILHEIRHALTKLLTDDQATTIDLRAIPMAPGEEVKIEAMLGEGEVSVKFNALGRSTFIETTIAGVWLVTHYNIEDEILGKFIEVTRFPSLVASQVEDIESGLERLTEQLQETES